jgi:hypothetical protein
MAHIIEIRNGTVVNNTDLTDQNLPVGTPVVRADGHYIGIGMDLDGPFDRAEAEAKLAHLKKATRLAIEEEIRTRDEPH